MASIHHITSVGRDMGFYTQVLGLKLVKKTVNFDDPYTYHIYFGDDIGSPGTALTFFLWDLPHGKKGAGEVSTIMYHASELGDWMKKLSSFSPKKLKRFSDSIISFTDPNGLQIELVDTGQNIGKFYGALIEVAEFDEAILTILGYKKIGKEGETVRFKGKDIIDIKYCPDKPPGRLGVGSVHHIAFEAKDDEEQLSLRSKLINLGISVTPQIDRKYFKSVYFQVPGGVLFEIATAGPGFLIDEDRKSLGSGLMLPRQYEPMREDIEKNLPPL